jgi:hypothetical protein
VAGKTEVHVPGHNIGEPPVRKYAIYHTLCQIYCSFSDAKAIDLLFCSRLAEDLLNHVAGYGLKRCHIHQDLNFPCSANDRSGAIVSKT